MTRKSPHDDRIRLFERLLMGPEETGAEYVDMPTDLCRYILDLAKRAPEPRPGRTVSRGRVIVRNALSIHWARRRKRQLEAEGMSATDALWQAAEETAKRSLLSAAMIRDRMQRKRSRR